jgi:hypothetical protein
LYTCVKTQKNTPLDTFLIGWPWVHQNLLGMPRFELGIMAHKTTVIPLHHTPGLYGSFFLKKKDRWSVSLAERANVLDKTRQTAGSKHVPHSVSLQRSAEPLPATGIRKWIRSRARVQLQGDGDEQVRGKGHCKGSFIDGHRSYQQQLWDYPGPLDACCQQSN